MLDYYEQTSALRALLAERRHEDLARELIDAERTGSTGGADLDLFNQHEGTGQVAELSC